MSDQEILRAAIAKAIARGWEQNLTWIHGNTKNKDETFLAWVSNLQISGYHAYYDYDDFFCVLELIYNHEFAKALWGDKFINPEMRDDKGSRVIALQQTAWRHHLRQMVVAENPIKYLGEHI